MSGLLDRLQTLGAVQPVDAALGRLLASKSAHDGDSIGLVAALASAALAQGHSCLPLTALRDFVATRLADDARAAEALVADLPTLDAVLAALIVFASGRSRWGDTGCACARCATTTVFAPLLSLRNHHRAGAAHASRPSDRKWCRSRNAAHRHWQNISTVETDALDREQRIAVLLALHSRFLLISGGPGTGKTTTVLRLLALTVEQALANRQPPPRIALAAPTGKAAARLGEILRALPEQISAAVRAALPPAASTVHRLIGLSPGRNQPRYHREQPLPFDLVVVDEASMLDLALAARLCEALTPETRLILLGDRDQLASVEAGSVFGALCAAAGESNRYSLATTKMLKNSLDGEITSTGTHMPLTDALVELQHSHRFDAAGAIGRFARALRTGQAGAAQRVLDEAAPELALRAIAERELAGTLEQEVLPKFIALTQATSPLDALDQLDRYRVLCALRAGPYGAETLNARIEQALRRCSTRADASGWFAGRLVMIASNDNRQGLFNGDIGIALATGTQGALEVWFRSADGGTRTLPPALLPAHRGAFALTVHKAQGSEFDEVLVVLPARDARVLTRELLYTAVTRARKKVELWASAETLAATIARSTRRWSGLADRLQTAL